MPTTHKIPGQLASFTPAKPSLYSKGEFIYLPDDLGINIYIITSGLVKIGGYSSAGREVMFDCIFPAEFFGNLKYIEGDFFHEYAKALVDTSVIEIKVERFKHLVHTEMEVSNWFHKVSTLRWYRAESRLFHISAEKPADRIYHLLPLLEQQVCDVQGQSHTITDLLSYQDIADLCGLSRQSAAQYIKKLSGKINH